MIDRTLFIHWFNKAYEALNHADKYDFSTLDGCYSIGTLCYASFMRAMYGFLVGIVEDDILQDLEDRNQALVRKSSTVLIRKDLSNWDVFIQNFPVGFQILKEDVPELNWVYHYYKILDLLDKEAIYCVPRFTLSELQENVLFIYSHLKLLFKLLIYYYDSLVVTGSLKTFREKFDISSYPLPTLEIIRGITKNINPEQLVIYSLENPLGSVVRG